MLRVSYDMFHIWISNIRDMKWLPQVLKVVVSGRNDSETWSWIWCSAFARQSEYHTEYYSYQCVCVCVENQDKHLTDFIFQTWTKSSRYLSNCVSPNRLKLNQSCCDQTNQTSVRCLYTYLSYCIVLYCIVLHCIAVQRTATFSRSIVGITRTRICRLNFAQVPIIFRLEVL